MRHTFLHDGLTLSYLDGGGDGPALVALHGHWMEGVTFAPLAARLAPAWRVIALDQRGHGHSDHAPTYTRDAYLGDLGALLAHLGLAEVALLGHSLGGVNAYQFAARHPERVRGLIVEDIGADVAADVDFVLGWAGTFATREQLGERVGPRFRPYLEDSFRETPGGWRLAFDPRDMVTSQAELNGDHWVDWLATDCPALLVRGDSSRLTTPEHLVEMAALRPGTRLTTLHGGHVVHADDPEAFGDAVAGFLAGLGPARE